MSLDTFDIATFLTLIFRNNCPLILNPHLWSGGNSIFPFYSDTSVHGDILYFSSAHGMWISPNLDFRFAKDKHMIVFTIIIISNYYYHQKLLYPINSWGWQPSEKQLYFEIHLLVVYIHIFSPRKRVKHSLG